jgi:small-conductance mechanosensitive channel
MHLEQTNCYNNRLNIEFREKGIKLLFNQRKSPLREDATNERRPNK